MARNVLRLVAVADGTEVGRLTLRPDGQVDTTVGAAAGILRTLVREEFPDNPAAAFAWLDQQGWSNGNLMIELP